MKRIVYILAVLACASAAYGQGNSKITDLSALSAPDAADVLNIVDVSAGVDGSKKITIANLLKGVIAENDILVAASDAPASLKALAPYECDGTADETEINAAIAALPDAGGRVILSPGNFVAEGITLVEGVQICGAGMYATKISLPASASTAMFVAAADASFDGGGIFDMELYGDAGKSQNGLDFSACTLVMEYYVQRCKLSYFAIGIRGAEASTANDRFLCVNDSCIWYCTTGASLREHPRLLNVDFRNNTTGLTGNFQHAEIVMCKWVTNTAGVVASAGNSIDQSSFNNCIFFGNTNVALSIDQNNVVSGCKVLGGTAETNIGIEIKGGRNTITGNSIGAASYRFDAGAILFNNDALLYDNVITGNFIYCNAGPAIKNDATAGGGTGEVRDTVVSSNTFKIDTTNTAVIDLSQGGRISNWSFANNIFDIDVTGCTVISIDDTNAVGNTFIGNQFNNQGASSFASVAIAADLRNSLVANNRFRLLDSPVTISNADTNTRIRNNTGMATVLVENSGTATVPNGATYVDVTHGLTTTPSATKIRVVATNNLGTASHFWVDTIGATTFRVNVDADPGATTATFSWEASVY